MTIHSLRCEKLIQNAVDACALRDALTVLHDPSITPGKNHRITIRYEEPAVEGVSPLLSVQDTGTGMDAWLIERWFLKVGRSYYSSSEFNKTRLALRAKNLDFAPVSEFGIGFLSCFLLADRVEVETAMWEPIRGDTRKRHLTIDGPTRLIRVREEENAGAGRFKGTKVTLHLCRGSSSDQAKAPAWDDIRKHIEWSCEDLPYALDLELAKDGQLRAGAVAPKSGIHLPPGVAQKAVRITVDDKVSGLEGEIVLVDPGFARKRERQATRQTPIVVGTEEGEYEDSSVLIRGGFRVGKVPGLPYIGGVSAVFARLRENWRLAQDRRYGRINLARSHVSHEEQLGLEVMRIWLTHLTKSRNQLPHGFIEGWNLRYGELPDNAWASFTFLEAFNALELYELARQGWRPHTRALVAPKGTKTEKQITSLERWESGVGLPIPLPRYYLSGQLLDLILPRVVSQIRAGENNQVWVYPPVENWRAQLSDCRDFIRNHREWPPFAEYPERLKELLFFQDYDFLNLELKSHFEGFGNSEVNDVIGALDVVVDAKSSAYQMRLSESQANALAKVLKINPDFIIGNGRKRWKISKLGIPL
jgi:hypothetical protein